MSEKYWKCRNHSENVGKLTENSAKYRAHIGTKSETHRSIFETIGKSVGYFGNCQKRVGELSENAGKHLKHIGTIRKMSEHAGQIRKYIRSF